MSALPVLTTPTFSGTIPSIKKKFTFRPFLTKEQKILLFALESGELINVYLALKDIIEACVKDTTLDVENMPIFDLESIFLQIGARSTGEIANVLATCSNCQKTTELEIPLLDVTLKNYQKGANKISLTDDIGIIIKYPTLADAINLVSSEKEEGIEKNPEEGKEIQSYDLLLNSIEAVYTAEKIYRLGEDYSIDDLGVFIDSLSIPQLKKVKEFLKKSPYLSYETTYRCPHCEHENQVEIKGIKDFFFVPSPMKT
jgi:transcription elongation factor Elf1